MLIGYARVSTSDQNLASQVKALQDAGCSKIFEDKASGAKADRPGLAAALKFARPGDCLVIWKLDRLGRSVKNLIELSSQLSDQGIELKSLSDGIDTSTSSGRFYFTVLAALAEMERDLIRERTLAGLEAARSNGRTGGRPTALTDEQRETARILLKDGGKGYSAVARELGVSRSTLYRYFPIEDESNAKD